MVIITKWINKSIVIDFYQQAIVIIKPATFFFSNFHGLLSAAVDIDWHQLLLIIKFWIDYACRYSSMIIKYQMAFWKIEAEYFCVVLLRLTWKLERRWSETKFILSNIEHIMAGSISFLWNVNIVLYHHFWTDLCNLLQIKAFIAHTTQLRVALHVQYIYVKLYQSIKVELWNHTTILLIMLCYNSYFIVQLSEI